jgi:hypothetical protein
MACNKLQDKAKAEADRSVPNGLYNILPIFQFRLSGTLDSAKSA